MVQELSKQALRCNGTLRLVGLGASGHPRLCHGAAMPPEPTQLPMAAGRTPDIACPLRKRCGLVSTRR